MLNQFQVAQNKTKLNSKGFTLIELLVVITIAGLLMGFAVPNLRVWLLNAKSVTQTQELMAALNSVRTEAVKSHGMVVLCPNPTDATAACGTDWSLGWRMVADTAATEQSATVTADATKDVLKVWPKPDKKSVLSFGSVTFIRFVSSGMLGANHTSTLSLSGYVKGCKGNNKGAISVGRGGSVSLTKGACPNV